MIDAAIILACVLAVCVLIGALGEYSRRITRAIARGDLDISHLID